MRPKERNKRGKPSHLVGLPNRVVPPHNSDTTVTGVTVNDAGDVVTVDETNNNGAIAAAKLVSGNMARFNEAGSNDNRASVYFYALDQYGTKAMKLANVVVVPSGTTLAATHTFSVSPTGDITSTNIGAGDTVVISGITTNGLVKTIKIIFQ